MIEARNDTYTGRTWAMQRGRESWRENGGWNRGVNRKGLTWQQLIQNQPEQEHTYRDLGTY